jgi:hypothetical protein
MRTYIRHPKNPNITCYLVETKKVSKGGLHKTSIYPINCYPNSKDPWMDIEWTNNSDTYFYDWYWKWYYHWKGIREAKKRIHY